MRAWFEPWKTENTVSGVPMIAHKAVGDDVFRQIYPAKILSVELIKKHIMPLWNPYNGAGQPLFAVQHFGLTNPLMLGFLFWSPEHAWTAIYIGQFAVLALSFLLYAGSLGISAIAALCGMVVLVFSGYVITNSLFATYIYGYAGLPFLLWSIDRVIQKDRFGSVALPCAVSWVLLTGFPQLSLYIYLVGASYALYRLYTHRDHAYSLGFRLIILAIIGLGVCAFQLIPMGELYQNAAITTESSAFIFRNFLLPARHFITIAIPNFFGNPATYNYWGPSEYIESASWIGSIAVFFSIVLVSRKAVKQHPLAGYFIGVVIVSVLLCIRWFGTEWFYRLPIPVLTTGAPSRIMSMATFAIAVLFGFGVDAYLKAKDVRRWIVWSIGMCGVFGLVLIFTYISNRSGVSCHNPTIHTCFSIAFRNTALEAALFGSLTLLLALSHWHVFHVSRRIVVLGMLCILCASGVYNAYKFIPFTKIEHVMPQHPLLAAMNSLSPSRVGYLGTVIPTDLASFYKFFDTNYYDPLYIRRYGELVSYVGTGDRLKGILRSDVNVVSDASASATVTDRREKFWDMTGTGAIVRKKSDGPCRPGAMWDSRSCDIVWEDDNWQLVRRPSALPRAYLVSDVRVAADADSELAQLFSSTTDVSKTAYVEEPIAAVASKTPTGSVNIDLYSANRVSVRVNTETSAFLVLSDTYYPGWKATIDGKETKIYRTNYAFRGIRVPKGNHVIVFFYDPMSVQIGVIGSGIAISIWILIIMRVCGNIFIHEKRKKGKQ